MLCCPPTSTENTQTDSRAAAMAARQQDQDSKHGSAQMQSIAVSGNRSVVRSAQQCTQSCPARVSHKLAGRKLGGERTRARADTCMPDTAACAHLGFIVRERGTAPLSACYVCQPITCSSSSSSQHHASLMLLVKQCTHLAWQLLPARSDILLACKLYTSQPPKPTRRCAQQFSPKLAVGTATAKREEVS